MARRSAARIFPPSLKRRRRSSPAPTPIWPRAQADYDRQRSLSKQATTRQDVDARHGGAKTGPSAGGADLGASHAELARAAADRRDRGAGRPGEGADRAGAGAARSADLNLSWTMVEAPQDGWITKRNVEMGIMSRRASRFSRSSRPKCGSPRISRKPARQHAPGNSRRA